MKAIGPPGSSTNRPAVDAAAFRAGRRERPLRPFEALLATERWADERLTRADETLTRGWTWKGDEYLELRPGIAWDEVCASNRSWHYHLHAWEFLAPVLPAHQATSEDRFLRYARDLILDWLRSYPSTDTTSPFAWYDMAVGLRAYRLGYVLDVSARDPTCPDEVIVRLIEGALLHAAVLADDSRFAAHSNHGLYQAAGQRALALRFPELPGMGEHEEQSLDRLSMMLEQQFTDEGIHREHSPGYHYLILEALERILACGLFDADWVHALADRSREALAWIAQPDGRLPRIGDTDERTVLGGPFSTTPNEALRFVATGGDEGRAPEERIRAFRDSGYVVMRDRWPSGSEDFGSGAHLVQMCAFHSLAHKHADDLSFVWYEHGGAVLDDAGRYGYLGRVDPGSRLGRLGFRYGDPKRIYVESTRAHNTVEMDETSYPRRVEPPGSMLRSWGDSNRACWTYAVAQHGAVGHRRVLVLLPGRWLLVVDWLGDHHGRRHRYTQRFHAPPEHQVEARGSGVRLAIRGAPFPLYGIALLGARFTGVVRGQTEPELLGWRSRKAHQIEPAPTFAWEDKRVSVRTFAALFAWGEAAPVPEPDRTQADAERISACLSWRGPSGQEEVVIQASEVGEESVRVWRASS